MVDAVSLSGNSYRAVSRALETRAPAPSAASALAALAVPQPVTRVSTPSETAEESGGLDFLYTPAGLPGSAALPAYAVPATQATDLQATGGRNGSARLGVESGELNSLLSSFLTARTPAANPAPSPDVPAEANSAELAQNARQSVVTQLYGQF